MKKLNLLCLLLVFTVAVSAQFKPASYMISGETLPYQIMYPKDYDENKQYPLLIFLHGAGEKGRDNQKQLTNGKEFLIQNFHENYSAIVIVPQCPRNDYWANVQRNQIEGQRISFDYNISNMPSRSMKTLIGLVNYWVKSGKVDIQKVYAGGLSMGGMGVFELLWRMPHTFVAAFPICGGGDLSKCHLYANNTALWIFHGDADNVVPVENSRKAYQTLKDLNCDVKYTEYPGVNHNSWDNAFKEKELAPWLFSHNLLEVDQTYSLPRSMPEAESVDPTEIEQYLTAVENSRQDLHSLMIVRHGKVVFEKWLGDNAPDKNHEVYSVSKTFTAMAVGFAISENKLKVTDKVISFFPDKLPAKIEPFLKDLEIRHLLTMSAGVDTDDAQKIRKSEGKDWVEEFLALPIKIKPGTKFVYNSMATYMLSAILQKITGEKVKDYLTPRLFQPLGISGITWNESPQGINNGGWGLFVKTEDMAKLGQFILQEGKWQDKQLLPKAWITDMTTPKISNMPTDISSKEVKTRKANSDWVQGYCYQMWKCRYNAVRADGANGQFIIVVPDKDAVIVTTANIDDMQSEINLIWKYILPAME